LPASAPETVRAGQTDHPNATGRAQSVLRYSQSRQISYITVISAMCACFQFPFVCSSACCLMSFNLSFPNRYQVCRLQYRPVVLWYCGVCSHWLRRNGIKSLCYLQPAGPVPSVRWQDHWDMANIEANLGAIVVTVCACGRRDVESVDTINVAK